MRLVVPVSPGITSEEVIDYSCEYPFLEWRFDYYRNGHSTHPSEYRKLINISKNENVKLIASLQGAFLLECMVGLDAFVYESSIMNSVGRVDINLSELFCVDFASSLLHIIEKHSYLDFLLNTNIKHDYLFLEAQKRNANISMITHPKDVNQFSDKPNSIGLLIDKINQSELEKIKIHSPETNIWIYYSNKNIDQNDLINLCDTIKRNYIIEPKD